MRKTLRLLSLITFVCLFPLNINAVEETINFSTLDLKNGVQYTELKGTAVTYKFGEGANDGKYYDTGTGIRVYGNGYMEVSVATGTISQIVITYHSSNKPTSNDIVNVGSYNKDTNTWTGNSNSVKFTRPSGSGHWRIQKVTVTYANDPDAVASPEITGDTPFEETSIITLKADKDATVYYTIDDTNPTTTSPKYTDPFTINETTTVKAIAVKDGKSSEVATKTFEKVTFTDATIAEVLTWTDAKKDYVNLVLNNAKVTYIDGTSIFLRENGNCIMLFNVNLPSVTLNATLSGNIKMNFELYNEIHEMKENSFTNEDDLTIIAGTNTELDATETTVADLLAKKNLCDLVLLKDVEIISDGATSPKYYIKSGSEQIQLWGNQSLSKAGVGATTNVYALCNSVYSGKAQIKPVKVGNWTLTGINNIEIDKASKNGVYNLNGVQMNDAKALPAGIYIINGKKVVVKTK